MFAPLNAGCTIFISNQAGGRFDAAGTLRMLTQFPVTSLCAAPTVWRMLILEPLEAYSVRGGCKTLASVTATLTGQHCLHSHVGPQTSLRSICSAGEPLNPEVLRRVHDSWQLTLREGYGTLGISSWCVQNYPSRPFLRSTPGVLAGSGQTETTAVMGNPFGHTVVPGSLGIQLPGYHILLDTADHGLVDPVTTIGAQDLEGELCLRLGAQRPVGLMVRPPVLLSAPAPRTCVFTLVVLSLRVCNLSPQMGYHGDVEKTASVMSDGLYHTGDIVRRDGSTGVYHYVARADDVFKSAGYRVSPFELENALLEHPAVAEAAVVASSDPLRTAVPKGI